MKTKLITFIIILTVAIATTVFILFGASADIDDAKNDIDKVIEENKFEDIYEIKITDIGESELGADANFYESVDSFDAGSAYVWKQKGTNDYAYIYIYQIDDEEKRSAFIKELPNAKNGFNVMENLICEYGDTVIFATNPVSYNKGESVSEEVIAELCSK